MTNWVFQRHSKTYCPLLRMVRAKADPITCWISLAMIDISIMTHKNSLVNFPYSLQHISAKWNPLREQQWVLFFYLSSNESIQNEMSRNTNQWLSLVERKVFAVGNQPECCTWEPIGVCSRRWRPIVSRRLDCLGLNRLRWLEDLGRWTSIACTDSTKISVGQ